MSETKQTLEQSTNRGLDLCGKQTVETVKSMTVEDYNQMLETEIGEDKLITTIRSIIQTGLSTQRYA